MDRKTLLRGAIMTFFMSLYCLFSFSQTTRAISGVVKDNAGEVMIGVNVLIKGTTNGTITDIDGNYKLTSVSEKSVLVVSYIGYLTQEIVIGNQSVINVTLLEDTKKLDEVVVIGYGVVKKRDLTGSVSSVKADEIAKVSSSNAIQAMQQKCRV